jgi:hypothetical protein
MTGNIPYSTKPVPTLGELRNVNINPATLVSGQVVAYNSTTQLWENSAGGGGGGATITGTDNAVVFKSGLNGDAPSDGITKQVASGGFTMNLDTTSKRVGINKINPATTLDVGGIAQFTDNLQTITISEQKIGLTTAGPNELKLYSHNLPAVVSGLTTIDSNVKKTGSSAFRSYNPDAFDAPNTTDEDSIYKIKLQNGTTKQSVGTPAFDIQEDYAGILGFPSGQVVEYQNKVPLNKPICVCRTAGPQVVAPATIRVVSSLGTQRGAPFFDDNVVYDPCQMRAKLTGGTGWNSFGAPVAYRVADLKVGWTINWSIHGTWSSGSSNRCDVYVVQYRNGVLLRNILVQQLESDVEFWCIGSRTFLTWSPSFVEDFDVLTDYYEVEITNQSTHDFTFNQADITAECWLAQ